MAPTSYRFAGALDRFLACLDAAVIDGSVTAAPDGESELAASVPTSVDGGRGTRVREADRLLASHLGTAAAEAS